MKRKKEKQEGLKPTGLTSLRSKPQSCVKEEDPIQTERPETDSVMEIYEPFLSDGFVSLNSDYAQLNLTRYWSFSIPYFSRYTAFF